MVYRNYFLASIIINLLTALAVLILKSFLPPLTPLFYGRPVGATQLTATLGLLIAPGISLLLTIVNLLLSFTVKDDFLKKVLAVSTAFISLLTTITVIKIIFLVGFF